VRTTLSSMWRVNSTMVFSLTKCPFVFCNVQNCPDLSNRALGQGYVDRPQRQILPYFEGIFSQTALEMGKPCMRDMVWRTGLFLREGA
jgi:hypothetical protein